MIYEEACDLCFRHGNVGRSLSDTMENKPTPQQLEAAAERVKRIIVAVINKHWEKV